MTPTCTLCGARHDDTKPCAPPTASGWDKWHGRAKTNSRGSKPFMAKFPGRCPVCGEDIEEGDSVRFDADDDVVHEEC